MWVGVDNRRGRLTSHRGRVGQIRARAQTWLTNAYVGVVDNCALRRILIATNLIASRRYQRDAAGRAFKLTGLRMVDLCVFARHAARTALQELKNPPEVFQAPAGC